MSLEGDWVQELVHSEPVSCALQIGLTEGACFVAIKKSLWLISPHAPGGSCRSGL